MRNTAWQVAVYGTLRKDQCRNFIFDEDAFIGQATIKGTMIDVGSFPAISLEGYNDIVIEVYKINEVILRKLDTIEGYPDFYDRQIIDTAFGLAWVYFWHDISDYPEIQSGDYNQHIHIDEEDAGNPRLVSL